MTKKGFITSLILSVFIGGISYFIKIPYTVILIGSFYCVMGFLLVKDKHMYEKIKEIINRDAYKQYAKKDDEFKIYIKDNSISYFLIGIVLFYLGYRIKEINFSYICSVAVGIIIFLNFLIEVYSITSSKSWLDYKKKSGMLTIALVAITILLI